MVKLTVTITGYTLKELKDLYRKYFGYPQNEKVTKSDIATWVGSLAQGDIDSVEFPDESM